jgi:hypothetical protein
MKVEISSRAFFTVSVPTLGGKMVKPCGAPGRYQHSELK